MTEDTKTTTDLQARMEGLARALADVPPDSALGLSGYASEARAIVAELPKPVDPDVLAVREILLAYASGVGGNDFDDAVTAYKRIKAGWSA